MMSDVEPEIRKVEERLRLAQLHSNIQALGELLDDHMLFLSDSRPFFAKARMLEMYQPHRGQNLISVEWHDVQIIPFGHAAIVICRADYRTPQLTISLRCMRMWLKQNGAWKLIAGTVAQPSCE